MIVNRSNINFLKELVDLGVTLKVPYKTDLDEWFSPQGITLSYFSGEYRVCCHGELTSTKNDFKKVYLYFVRCANNVGAVQMRIQEKYRETLDPESDWKKIKELVQEEMKKIPQETRCPIPKT